MNIAPHRLSIAQLFASNNEQFIVPSYQRRYAWGYNQTAALFDDIAMLKKEDGHLLGMIILHCETHSGDLNRPELVDGQQRLTTLAILLKAMQSRFLELENMDKVSDIEKMLTCHGLDEKKLPKLELGDLDHDDLNTLLSNDRTKEFTNHNIKEAYDNFKNRIDVLKNDELQKYFFSLTNVAVIIRLDVEKAQDAYKLFETINNRGLRLSPTDIIKNFLLGHAAKLEPEIFVKTKSLWSSIITNLDGIDSDDFLRQYLCSLLVRKVSSSQMVYEFKKYYFKHIKDADKLGEFSYYVDEKVLNDEEETNGEELTSEQEIDNGKDSQITIIEFLQKIEEISKVYRKISLEEYEEEKVNRHIKYLNKILSRPTYIFLMHFLQKNLSESIKVEVLKVLEAFMLRRHICEKRTGELDDIFSKTMKIIESTDIVGDLRKQLAPDVPSDEAFKNSFPLHVFKGKLIDRAKYVPEQIEYHVNGNTGELIVASSSEVELEHVIPQTISTKRSKEEYGDWEEYLGPNSLQLHEKFINLIGNMTLLADALNIQAYNNPFAKKKNSYKKSNFVITNELAKLSNFRFPNVSKRGQALAEKATKIWKV